MMHSSTLVSAGSRPVDPALKDRVAALNDRFRHHSATAVLQAVLREDLVGPTALVSSFGAESVALLHLVAMANRDTPVLFIDTQMLFVETLVYQSDVAERLGLRNVRVIRPKTYDLALSDPQSTLHQRDTDACCALRKVQPLNAALDGFDAWITGRKRFQGGQRDTLDFFEVEEATSRIKVNPLAHWAKEDVAAYMDENRLPRHPLVRQGYPSIGCAPCTSRVEDGEDERAGRWRGTEKVECGIHFVDGKMVRIGANK